MASAALKKYGSNHVKYGLAKHNYRTGKNHSNPDIDPTRSHLNRHYGAQTEEEFKERFKSMVEECDAKKPPKRKKADRKTYLAVNIPDPREGMTAEDSARWSEKTWEVMNELFPGQIPGATYHADEIHKYTDPHDHQEHKSRGHTHYGIIPWTDEYGLNMDKFYRRDLPNKINAALDKACMEMFGFPFRDGTGAKSRGTVEEMKRESAIAALDKQVENMQNKALDMQDIINDKQSALAFLDSKNAEIKDAGDRLLAGIDGMVRAHDGLRRVLQRPFVQQRDRIEVVQDKTETRTEKALKRPLDSIDDLLNAANEVERATRVYSKLKTAAKGDIDIDDVLEDDDFGLD